MSETPAATQATTEVAQVATATTAQTTETKPVTEVANTAAEKAAPATEVKTDETAAQTKTAEAKAPEVQKPVVPEKYELNLPNGSTLKQDEVDKIAALAKERGLSNDDAQKLVEEKSQEKTNFIEAQKQEFSQLRATWKDQFIKDPELGGENAKASAEHAKRFVDRFASDDLKKAFNETGFGDHPELIRLMARAGKAMANDQIVQPGKHGGSELIDAKDVLYPSHKQS